MKYLRLVLTKLIKQVFNKAGYHICAINTKQMEDIKYRELIIELVGLYADFQFKEMPAYREERINLMSKLLGTGISEAIYLINYLNKSLIINGDICEFGVAQGATSALFANEIRETDKSIWLFDSFEGLPKPTKEDLLKDNIFGLGSIDAYTGEMACNIDQVMGRLKATDFPFSRVKFIKGFIEETIKQPYLPSSVCFAYLDFDFYKPISVALNFLDKVLQIGGVVIVDDYDYFSAGVKVAVDEFVELNKDQYSLDFPIKCAGHFCILTKIS